MGDKKKTIQSKEILDLSGVSIVINGVRNEEIELYIKFFYPKILEEIERLKEKSVFKDNEEAKLTRLFLSQINLLNLRFSPGNELHGYFKRLNKDGSEKKGAPWVRYP